jgi:hypothetical protein
MNLIVSRGEKVLQSSDKSVFVAVSTLSQWLQKQQSCKSAEQSRGRASDHPDGGDL